MNHFQKQSIIICLIGDMNRIKKLIWDINEHNNTTRIQDITSHVRFRLKVNSIAYKNPIK